MKIGLPRKFEAQEPVTVRFPCETPEVCTGSYRLGSFRKGNAAFQVFKDRRACSVVFLLAERELSGETFGMAVELSYEQWNELRDALGEE